MSHRNRRLLAIHDSLSLLLLYYGLVPAGALPSSLFLSRVSTINITTAQGRAARIMCVYYIIKEKVPAETRDR